jgi:hypothetical protein
MRDFRRLLLIAGMVTAALSTARGDEFADELRGVFQLPASAQIVWPPRASLQAGSIVDPALHVIATDTKALDSVIVDHEPVSIAVPAERLQPPEAFWIWRSLLANPHRFVIKMNLSAIEIRNLTPTDSAPAKLVRKADGEKLQAVGMARVRRSWMAQASLEVLPGPEIAPKEWFDIRKATLDDKTDTMRALGNSVVLSFPDKVTLAIESERNDTTVVTPPHEGPIAGPKKWALATIASGRYQFLPDMQQDWNERSAGLVADALSDWRPTLSRALTPADAMGLTRQGVLTFLDAFAQDARKAKADLLVVYYVGHMERTGTGALSLLMGDAPAKRQIRPPAPSSGIGNLRDIMQVVDQAEAELAPRPGSLDVAVIHRQLGRAKIPFVLLVDGCLEDPSFADARQRLGIVVDAHGGEPVYVGPGDAGTALHEQIAKLQAYPQDFPWLKAKEPTILGATPGTAAYREENPVWLLGGTVGPIARRLFDIVARTRWNSDRPNLIRVLDFSADRQSIGPQELVGTVSWSDWLPYLRRFDPASFKR